jgi:actin related protein 2/3 complex subunit 3
LDEALEYFKANVFFRTFEVKGSADILLIYATLYISQCLGKIKGRSKADASKQLFSLAVENFALPGDGNFPLGGMVAAPSNRGEAGVSHFIV